MKKLATIAVLVFLGQTFGFCDQVAATKFKGLNNNENSVIILPEEAQDLLNVDVSPGGASIAKRDGFGVYRALATGQAIHGGHHAFDGTGNDYQLWGSSTSLYSIVADGTPAQLISSATLNSTWDCADTQGNSYCVNSNRNLYLVTDGTTKTWKLTPLGTMVESTPDRVIVAGVSGSPNTLYVSQSNTFTNFTTGVNATDAFTEVIASPGSKLTHIRWGCGKLLWWKDQSFGWFDFEDQFQAQVKTVSDTIGTFDNTSAIDPGGQVWFRGQDGHTYKYDCSSLEKMSIDITPNIQASGKRVSNSWTQTTQADWQAGLISTNGPSNGLSTTISASDIVPSSITITDTDSSDFSQGTGTAIDTTTVSGSVTLKTYENEDCSSLSEWTNESTAFTTGNWSVSGGRCVSSDITQAKLTATPSPVGDFIVSFKLYANATFRIGLLDSSGNAGYRFSYGSCVINISEDTDFNDVNSGVVSSTTSSLSPNCSPTGDALLFTRDNTTGVMAMYYNGELRGTLTDSTYTSFQDIKVQSEFADVDDIVIVARKGNFNSRLFDTSFSSPIYGTFTANSNSTGTISYAVRTSSNSSSTYSADSAITTGSRITTGVLKRYLIYSSTLTAALSTTILPQLTDVSVVAASTGTFYSQVKNATNLNAWSTFGANSQTNGGTHTFYVRSSTFGFTTAATSPTWTAQGVGSLVGVSTGTYFQVRDDFVITTATQNPTLNDFTVNWFEGSASDQAYMLYFDNAIWESVAFGAGQATNNYIFKFDLINEGWTLYNFGAGGMLVQTNTLYFGDTSTSGGNVFNYGTATSDNGTAVQSFWRSKSYTGPDPFLQTALTNIDIFAKKDNGTTITATYTTDTSTATAYSVSLSTSNAIVQSRKLLPSGKLGYTWDLKLGDTSTSSAWEVLGYRIGFNSLPYRPQN